MKKIYFTLALLTGLFFFWSCQDTNIGDINLDFKAQLTAEMENTFVGKPVQIGISVSDLDPENNFPFETTIVVENVKMLSGNSAINSGQKLAHDYKKSGTLYIEFTPTQQCEKDVIITIKNEKVTKTLPFKLICNRFFYETNVSGMPERPLIEKKFDFQLLLKEMENTQMDSVRAYARVIKGEGTVYTGEDIISTTEEGITTRTAGLAIGKNTVTYLSKKEGENVIRFFVTNKWGNEATFDVPVQINLPEWAVSSSFGEEAKEIPFDDPYSFNLSVDEADIFDQNSYTASYRILTNTTLKLSINNQDYDQGASFPLKAGTNVGTITIKDASDGQIEFIVKDKYKQEHKHLIEFSSKLPVKPIEASLDANSQSVKVNEPAVFRLTLKEQHYTDVFTVKFDIINGKGDFANGEQQTFSEGTHTIRFTPKSGGTHTFRIIVTDKNQQEKIIPATVQASLENLKANLNLSSVTIEQGETTEVLLTVTEKDYSGAYTLRYDFTGTGGTIKVNNIVLGTGQSTSFTNTENRILFTGSQVGSTSYKFYVADEYQQETVVVLNTRVTGKVVVLAGSGGTVQGGGSFDLNQSCTVIATPATGYTFDGWYEGAHKVSASATYIFNVTKSVNLEARFEVKGYSISATAGEGGTSTGGGNFQYGTQCVLRATVNTGYTFDGWYEGTQKVSGTLEYSFTVTGDRTIRAKFNANIYVITVNAGLGGTVAGGGSYEHNKICRVVATISDGYAFDGWYVSNQKVSNSTIYEFTVVQSQSLEARFIANAYGVTVNGGEGGTATGGGNYYHGDNITVTAVPHDGYTFDGWYEGSTRISTSTIYNFRVTKPITLDAKFKAKEFTVVVNATTGGSATGGGKFLYNTNATVIAVVNDGYSFTGWYEGSAHISNSLNYTFKVTADRSIEARFTANVYNVVVNAGAGGSATGSGNFAFGSTVTVKATPDTNYSFDGWYEGENKVSTSPTYTFTLNGSRSLEARFKTLKYNIEIVSLFGTVTGGGMYDYGAVATLYATPAATYSFDGWYENDEEVTTSNPYAFRVDKARIIQARYSQIKHDITVLAEEGGAVTGGGLYVHNTNATIQAFPEKDYLFDGWYEGPVKVSTSSSYAFPVTKPRTLTAKFILNTRTVSLFAGAGGTVSGAGNFTLGSNVTIVATPQQHYSFDGWYLNNGLFATDARHTFQLQNNITLEARFKLTEYRVNITYGSDGADQPNYGSERGTVSGSGNFTAGQTTTVTAIPARGYDFVGFYTTPTGPQGWLSDESRFNHTVTSSINIYARFNLKTDYVTVPRWYYTVSSSSSGYNTGYYFTAKYNKWAQKNKPYTLVLEIPEANEARLPTNYNKNSSIFRELNNNTNIIFNSMKNLDAGIEIQFTPLVNGTLDIKIVNRTFTFEVVD